MTLPPITPRLLRTLLNRICDKEGRFSSIGLADGVVVGSNHAHCIVIGDGEVTTLQVTDRDETLVEAERARIYKRWAELDELPIQPTELNRPLGDVPSVMARLDAMPKAITVRPEQLISAAQVAIAAGATLITLYAEPGDPELPVLGYTCEYEPTDGDGQYSLETEDTGTVHVRGLVAGYKEDKGVPEPPTPEDPEAHLRRIIEDIGPGNISVTLAGDPEHSMPFEPDATSSEEHLASVAVAEPEPPLVIVSHDTEPEAFDVEIDGEHYAAALTRRYLVEGDVMDNLNAVCEATGEYHNRLLLTSHTPGPGPELNAYIEKTVRSMFQI